MKNTVNDFMERFSVMVDELLLDPRVLVTNYCVGEPASEATIQQVEAALGWALHESIKSFFRQANGLQLRWLQVGGKEQKAAQDGF